MKELLFSTDVECYGPHPGTYSMLSIGCAVFQMDSEIVLEKFSVNLELLDNAKEPHPKTKEFWDKFPEQFALTRVNTVQPKQAMADFEKFVRETIGTKYVASFGAYPAGYDFSWIYWYFNEFLDYCPFGWSAIDFKTYFMAISDRTFRESVKKHMPRSWFVPIPHNHVAIDDAIEQGIMFIRMRKARTKFIV